MSATGFCACCGWSPDAVAALVSALQRHDVAAITPGALTQAQAAAWLSVSEDFFVAHIRTELRCVRRGRRRLFPVAELNRWLDREAALALTHER
jgi:excisionase family DNA binding protein